MNLQEKKYWNFTIDKLKEISVILSKLKYIDRLVDECLKEATVANICRTHYVLNYLLIVTL